MVGAPHGAICAVLLPEVVAANVKALRQREPGNMALARYGELGLLLTGDAEATVDDTIAWLRALVAGLEIPPLSHYGFTRADAPALVEKARAASSMKANPIVLTDEELTAIVDAAC
jgi:alcohol dehydrogenase class IV